MTVVPAMAQTQDDIEKQRKEYMEKAETKLNERVLLFTSQLDADDFQKEIIKQKLRTYYEAQKSIYTDPTLKYYERDEQMSKLGATHFSDIENLISKENMSEIQSFILDAGTSLEKQKKKKKKNKKKNKKYKDE